MLSTVLQETIRSTAASDMPLTMLDVGAGHGGYTEHALAAGCIVTATEMSRASLNVMEGRFGTNPAFRGVFDAEGNLGTLGNERYSIIMCCSVLHHIADYLTFIMGPVFDHLAVGGTFLSIQDPLWYPTVGSLNHMAGRVAYLTWRVSQGSYLRGLSTLGRRLSGRLDETKEADMSEYHVVRQGVDETAIMETLRHRFTEVNLGKYWSTQARSLQWLGERAGLRTNFYFKATNFRD